MADTPLYPWMPQFYCDDMYWLVTVESLPRALFNQEADARRYFEAADAPEVGGGLHLWRLNGGHLCRPHVASKEAPEVEAVQAQPASATLTEAAQKVVRIALDNVEVHPCDRNNDEVRAKFLWSEIAELRNALVAAQPASAPMGEPSGEAAANALEALQAVISYFWCAEREPGGLREWDVEGLVRGAESALRTTLASPAQARMPLSEEQIVKLAERYDVRSTVNTYGEEIINFARAVEAAHGISGDSSGAAHKDDVKGGNHG